MSNSVFQDRIKSNKLILCIIAIAIFVVDTLLAVLLAIGGELFSIGLPIFLIAILDIVLLLGVFFSNFRLKYSIVIPIIYMVLSSVIGVFLSSVLAKTVFTTIAFILSGIFRVLAIITLIFAIVNGANRGKGAKFFAFILSIILIGFSAFYVYNVLPNGYFGQGGVGVRNISYEYNQAKGGYVANLVAGNKGDKIIVANQFNGEKVVGVNSEIFSTKGVKEVELNCDTGFFIENETGLKNMDSSLVISVDKEKINEVRQYLYNKAQGQQANNYLNFANRITPNGLEKDEVYINFDYSLSDLQYAKYEVIDTWFGHKGDVFSLVEHAGSISYVGEYNLDDENFLKANYDRGGKVIDELTFNGQAIIGNAVEDNMPNTQIVFENVRRVYVQEDNDTKYNLTTEDKNFVKKDGLECRYVLQSDPFKMLSEIKDRVGFTVSFAYSKQNSSIKTNTTIEDFSKALTSDILVYPEWKLNAPKVSNIQGTKVYTYGDELNISATATHDIATGVTFEYAWTKSASTTILSTDNSYTKTNVKPLADTDVYKIAVTAKPSCTSLTSTAEVTTSVTVNKKQLNFTWDKSQTIYSGANQTITANYQASDVINNDTIQGYIAGDSSVTNFTAVAKNAGKYDYAVILTGECANLYAVNSSNANHSWQITPYEIEVDWVVGNYVYNANVQQPTISDMNGIGDESSTALVFSVENIQNGGKDAGEHIAEVKLSDPTQANNYKITNTTQDYSIEQKAVSLTWTDLALTYNANLQQPSASVNDACSGDNVYALVSGAKKDVGDYTATATLSDRNYKIELGYESNSYTISPKPITLSWSAEVLTYEFKEKTPIASAVGLCGNDRLEFTYTGYGKNFGNYTATATIKDNANYVISGSNTKDFSIAKRSISISWSNTTKTYSGQAQKPTASLSGVISGDICNVTIALNGEGINAGTYTATASISNDNYYLSSNTKAFTISKKALTVTANSAAITYGEAPINAGYAISGFVNGEDQSDLTGSIAYSYTYSQYGSVGTYKINVSGFSSNNYSIQNTAGNLVVSPRPITVTIADKTSMYGKTLQTLTASITSGNLINNDSTPYSLSTTASSTKNAGIYDITGITKNSNYNVTFIKGEYEITKATLTVTANAKTVVTYGATSIIYQATYSTNNGKSTSVTYSSVVNSTTNVGEYDYTVNYDSTNYNLVKVNEDNFKVVVNPREVTLSWSVNSQYTLSNYSQLKPTASGVNISSLGLVYTYQAVSGNVQNNKPTKDGTYKVTVSTQNQNYVLKGSLTAQFTIKTASNGN